MVEIEENKSYTRAYKAVPHAQLHTDDSWSFEMGPIKLGKERDLNLFGMAVKDQEFNGKFCVTILIWLNLQQQISQECWNDKLIAKHNQLYSISYHINLPYCMHLKVFIKFSKL